MLLPAYQVLVVVMVVTLVLEVLLRGLHLGLGAWGLGLVDSGRRQEVRVQQREVAMSRTSIRGGKSGGGDAMI